MLKQKPVGKIFRFSAYDLLFPLGINWLTQLIVVHGAMAWWLRRWITNPGVPCSKPLGGSKVDSAFHPSEVDKMSTRKFWELNGRK